MDYKIFDPNNVSSEEAMLRDVLRKRDINEPVSVRGFTTFSMALTEGFWRINYEAHVRPSDGAFYWIDRQHARQIGRVLTRDLEYLGLELTTTEEGGFGVLTEEAASDIRIREMVISHRSADEVKTSEAGDLARFISKVRTRLFRLWAAEYEPGALETFQDVLLSVDNPFLEELDVCDIRRPEPEDRIELPRLAQLLARNSKRYD